MSRSGKDKICSQTSGFTPRVQTDQVDQQPDIVMRTDLADDTQDVEHHAQFSLALAESDDEEEAKLAADNWNKMSLLPTSPRPLLKVHSADSGDPQLAMGHRPLQKLHSEGCVTSSSTSAMNNNNNNTWDMTQRRKTCIVKLDGCRYTIGNGSTLCLLFLILSSINHTKVYRNEYV